MDEGIVKIMDAVSDKETQQENVLDTILHGPPFNVTKSYQNRYIICEDEMIEIQYICCYKKANMKNVLDAILQCPPSTDNQHLRCQSQLRSPEISFCSQHQWKLQTNTLQ